MNFLILCLTMISIGALIGGVTNLLAIRMLFRPYDAKYFGKWRIPFTPGLIPKRQDELANQLGRLVTNYLVTTASIQSKLREPMYQEQLERFLLRNWYDLNEQKLTLHQLIDKTGVLLTEKRIEETIEQALEKRLKDFYEKHKSNPIDQYISDEMNEQALQFIPQIRVQLLEKVERYIQSTEGKHQLSLFADRFLREKGFLGRMVIQYLGEKRISEKLLPSILQALQSEELKETTDRLLVNEWESIKKYELETIREKVFPEIDEKQFAQKLVQVFNVNKQINRPLSDMLYPYKERIEKTVIPQIAKQTIDLLATRLPRMMKHLNLAGLVENEVKNFEIKQLEGMLIEITKRELKMITYLGALLGGAIGFFQAILVSIIG
ncbi:MULTISPECIES: DUF445 domain-containing protein [Allobacillus]|uniref:DUF445 family protein n=1 Tax=Allobacillus halotolerans TaxID=570278 RepID=A0ABS6GR89_9BACI|nr:MULTISPECIES: DUF445 family protein [Allobacillus]MBU6081619.1 DUF445 family protein [Allobacillus halotolerans]TSJ66325.1 DUF445 family protein [Allobacillus sp. SKP2-8]